MYGDSHCDCETQRLSSINAIASNNGIFIHLPQEAQGWGLSYKLKELELQLSGRIEDGTFIGIKDRDEAQKILLNNTKFVDNRTYEIIPKILKELKLEKNSFIMLTENTKKIKSLNNMGLDVINFNEYKENEINEDNLSEYLIKILNNTHNYSKETIEKILKKIKSREYNERTLSTLVSLVNKIKSDKNYKLDSEIKSSILDAYSSIICGKEKKYYVGEENIVKIQNNFSCRVNASIFKIITTIYNKNIFERVSLEKIYYFQNKYSEQIVKIRTSEVLDVRDNKSLFFIGQHHAEQRSVNMENGTIIQNEVTISRLRSFFENPNYNYIKTVEMITTISENDIKGVKIFIKRIPTIENRVLDIFGKKNDIKVFIDKIMEYGQNVLLNSVTNEEYANENFTDFNLRFADINGIIEEELEVFKLMK